MKNMMHRAVEHMEREPSRAYTLTELRKAAGIALRSQYKLSQQLLASGMVERCVGGYRFHPYLLSMTEESIERLSGHRMDRLDLRLLRGELTKAEYDAAVLKLARWAETQYERLGR